MYIYIYIIYNVYICIHIYIYTYVHIYIVLNSLSSGITASQIPGQAWDGGLVGRWNQPGIQTVHRGTGRQFFSAHPAYHGIGWWENLKETPIFDGKSHGFRLRFSQLNQSIEHTLTSSKPSLVAISKTGCGLQINPPSGSKKGFIGVGTYELTSVYYDHYQVANS